MGGHTDWRGERLTPAAAKTVGDFLGSHTTMTLATSGEDGPWAAALFYAHDSDLNLYFISAKDTRHAADIERNPRVAVAVNAQHKDWSDIRGLQIGGVAEIVPPDQRAGAVETYLAKFPDFRPLFSAPRDEQESRIARAFAASPFYRVRPNRIRLIDNRKSFGHRDEYTLT
ncbi:MAG: pyridoxamine 5'-phosphate oxidase family protein [Proteobacteria bacterium]|nr:pyridoxamine 5'-phosphate oxidase family protein [Pseudomonadota bacterium]